MEAGKAVLADNTVHLTGGGAVIALLIILAIGVALYLGSRDD